MADMQDLEMDDASNNKAAMDERFFGDEDLNEKSVWDPLKMGMR